MRRHPPACGRGLLPVPLHLGAAPAQPTPLNYVLHPSVPNNGAAQKAEPGLRPQNLIEMPQYWISVCHHDMQVSMTGVLCPKT